MIIRPDGLRSVAVIGAGMAGMTCAASLVEHIPEVVVFEQCGQPGGRMAVHREDGYEFDYGTQFFTVHDEVFAARVLVWAQEWLVDEWRGWRVDLAEGHALSREDTARFYIGRPGMDSIVQHLSSVCDVRLCVQINAVQRFDEQWYLSTHDGHEVGPFDAVVLAVPAPVAGRLLEGVSTLSSQVAALQTVPCWVVMLGFSERLNIGYDAAYMVDPELAWMARNNSKPERPAHESWVLHASNEWSERHVNACSEDVIRQQFAAMQRLTGENLPASTFAKAYYWQNALSVGTVNQGCLYDADLRLGLCGDWCVAARVEGAFLSGSKMAECLLQHA